MKGGNNDRRSETPPGSKREGFIDEVYTRLPTHRSMVDAHWAVEYDHMSFFDRPRYSGHESFKTQVSKARRKKERM